MIVECDPKHCKKGVCPTWEGCPAKAGMVFVPVTQQSLLAENERLKAELAAFKAMKETLAPAVVVTPPLPPAKTEVVDKAKRGRPLKA